MSLSMNHAVSQFCISPQTIQFKSNTQTNNIKNIKHERVQEIENKKKKKQKTALIICASILSGLTACAGMLGNKIMTKNGNNGNIFQKVGVGYKNIFKKIMNEDVVADLIELILSITK